MLGKYTIDDILKKINEKKGIDVARIEHKIKKMRLNDIVELSGVDLAVIKYLDGSFDVFYYVRKEKDTDFWRVQSCEDGEYRTIDWLGRTLTEENTISAFKFQEYCQDASMSYKALPIKFFADDRFVYGVKVIEKQRYLAVLRNKKATEQDIDFEEQKEYLKNIARNIKERQDQAKQYYVKLKVFNELEECVDEYLEIN